MRDSASRDHLYRVACQINFGLRQVACTSVKLSLADVTQIRKVLDRLKWLGYRTSVLHAFRNGVSENSLGYVAPNIKSSLGHEAMYYLSSFFTGSPMLIMWRADTVPQ